MVYSGEDLIDGIILQAIIPTYTIQTIGQDEALRLEV